MEQASGRLQRQLSESADALEAAQAAAAARERELQDLVQRERERAQTSLTESLQQAKDEFLRRERQLTEDLELLRARAAAQEAAATDGSEQTAELRATITQLESLLAQTRTQADAAEARRTAAEAELRQALVAAEDRVTEPIFF